MFMLSKYVDTTCMQRKNYFTELQLFYKIILYIPCVKYSRVQVIFLQLFSQKTEFLVQNILNFEAERSLMGVEIEKQQKDTEIANQKEEIVRYKTEIVVQPEQIAHYQTKTVNRRKRQFVIRQRQLFSGSRKLITRQRWLPNQKEEIVRFKTEIVVQLEQIAHYQTETVNQKGEIQFVLRHRQFRRRRRQFVIRQLISKSKYIITCKTESVAVVGKSRPSIKRP